MAKARMYCTLICPYCVRAERLLSARGVPVDKIRVDQDPQQFHLMVSLTGRRTVPQIFIGDRHIGGYDDLVEFDYSGELKEWLTSQGMAE
jgi:glutaredoxin 3